jgi:hypothetical protein
MGRNEAISTITKNELIHYYKKINYNNRSRYKRIEYCYDILGRDEEIIETKRHNALNKPAVVIYLGNKIIKLEYWYKGERHRNWAPAILELDGKEIIFESWYHNGTKLTEKEIDKIKKTLDRRKKVLKLMIKGLKKKKGVV